MRLYKLGAHTKTDLKVQLIWIPKYRKRYNLTYVAIGVSPFEKEVLGQTFLGTWVLGS